LGPVVLAQTSPSTAQATAQPVATLLLPLFLPLWRVPRVALPVRVLVQLSRHQQLISVIQHLLAVALGRQQELQPVHPVQQVVVVRPVLTVQAEHRQPAVQRVLGQAALETLAIQQPVLMVHSLVVPTALVAAAPPAPVQTQALVERMAAAVAVAPEYSLVMPLAVPGLMASLSLTIRRQPKEICSSCSK
jgi:hypothetical protein